MDVRVLIFFLFFFNDTATTEIYTLSLHDALPIWHLLPTPWKPGPLVIAEQGRVALGDEIGELLGARLVVVLIGERPGLSSPDSLGAYLTWGPRVGRTDAERNCISNIRPEGLAYGEAARRLVWLCTAARRLRYSGVALKDDSDATLPGGTAPPTGCLPAGGGSD